MMKTTNLSTILVRFFMGLCICTGIFLFSSVIRENQAVFARGGTPIVPGGAVLLGLVDGEAFEIAMERSRQTTVGSADLETDPKLAPDDPNAPPITVGSGCTYATISAAIAAADPGRTIFIEGGVSFSEKLVIDKDLTLQGGYSGCHSGSTDRTTIDGLGLTGPMVDISNGNVTLSELRIVDSSGASRGGGIAASGVTEVVLDHVDILGNQAHFGGGGISIAAGTVVTATNNSWIASNIVTEGPGGGVEVLGTFYAEESSDIEDNYAEDGGGILVDGGLVDLDNSWVRYNEAFSVNGMGGGIYALGGSTVNLTNSTSVSDNDAYDGGGIYADGSDVNVRIAFFHTNTSNHNGGGLHLTNGANLEGGAFRIGGEDAILGNYAENGAGLYAISSIVTLAGGQIYANFADYNGGGIYADNTTLDLEQVTIGRPTGARPNQVGVDGHHGAGMFLNNGTTATLSDTVVAGNVIQATDLAHGGGIYAGQNCTLLLESGSTVESNSIPAAIPGRGGGIFAFNAVVTVDNSQVVSNTARSGGGLFLNNTSELNLQNDAVVSYNTADTEEGGGIASIGNNDINLSNTTMHENFSSADGGGIFLQSGTLDMTGWWDLRWNKTTGNGGGVAVTETGDADFYVTSGESQSFLAVNSAIGGNGGGLYVGNDDTVDLHAVDGYSLNFNTNSASLSGGGAYLDDAGTLFILGEVQATSNHASDNGGGIALDNGSILQVFASGTSQPEFMVNYADNGGGVYATSGSLFACGGAVFGGSVNGNRADAGSGGAVYLDGAALQAVNCTFRNNKAVMHGGAIAAFDSAVIIDADYDDCDPTAEICSNFYNNLADSDANTSGNGGVLYNHDSDFLIDHSYIHNNTAYLGGAIYQTGTLVTGEVKNSLFFGNASAGVAGAAIRVFRGDFSVEHVTLANNQGAAAFSSESTDAVKVFNSIAWENPLGGFNGLVRDYGCNIDQSNNVGSVEDPLFVDTSTDNYHLIMGSPAIDACPSGLPLDLDGIVRPIGGMYDMGVFEFLKGLFLPLVLH